MLMIVVWSLDGIGDDAAFVEGGLIAIDIKVGFCSFLDGDVVAGVMSDVVLSGPDDFVFGVIEELVPVGEPSDHSGDHEEDGEHIRWKSHGAVDDPAVEIDVGVKLSFDEVGVGEGDAFELDCDFDEFLFSGDLEDLFGDAFDDLGSGVVVFVDPVAEAVEQSFFVLYVLDELRDVWFFANRLEHPQHCLIGTAVLAAVEGTGRPCDCCVDIDAGRWEVAHRSGGAV